MGTGEAFVKWLRPAGCVLFLGLFILVTVVLFTARGIPVEGYNAPNDSEYYSERLTELAQELNDNLFPIMDIDWAKAEAGEDRVTVTADKDDLNAVRSGILHYYDVELFVFEEG